MLINAVNAVIKSKEMNVFKNDVFKRIVLTSLPLEFFEIRIEGRATNVKIIIRPLVPFTYESSILGIEKSKITGIKKVMLWCLF